MTRFILPTVLIIIALTVLFVFVSPIYGEIGQLRMQMASYNEALSNSKTLENERDKLTTKYNSINPDDIAKLQKLLPDNIDNIRLILEIEQVALPYGMKLADVKYDTLDQNATLAPVPGAVQGIQGANVAVAQSGNSDYGTWNLEFSTTGTYANFLNFTKELESNLRIVDISSIQFSSNLDTRLASGVSPDTYKYDFKIKTYWLKK